MTLTGTGAFVRTWLIAAGLLIGLAGAAQAQALNERWHGRWVDESDPKNSLVITDKVFTENGKACTWSLKPVSGVRACMAFYSGKASKGDLAGRVKSAESWIPNLEPKQVPEVRAQLRRLNALLKEMSNDTFRTVVTLTPDMEMGSGDCGSFYLLDKEWIYRHFYCEPDPAGVRIDRFRRQP